MAIPRRVTVVEEGSSGLPAGKAVGEEPAVYLLKILEEVADCVRAGQYTANEPDGILVDLIVESTRCLLLVHEPSLPVQLTPREQEIARMVANGRTNQAIAGALDISIWTVSTHLRRIFAKLAVCSRAEMVAHMLGQRDFSRNGPCASAAQRASAGCGARS
jgi:DNA-binding CsgD family transcriptional regulator